MTRTRTIRTAAAVGALALVLAACGGDDDSAATTTAAETTTTVDATTTTTAAPETTTTVEATTTTAAPETTTTVDAEPEPGLGSLLEVAEAAGDFTILLTAVELTGLTDELSVRSRTVLAPTDEAFEALGADAIDALIADPDTLRAIVLDHVLPLPQTAADIALFTNVIAVGGGSWVVEAGDPFRIGPATVITADIEADNGYIHVLDTVLLPEPPAED